MNRMLSLVTDPVPSALRASFARLSRGGAVVLMVILTFLWATAGVFTRQIQHASGVEVTFWRSALTAISMVLILTVWRGVGYWRRVQWADKTLWLSSLFWAAMYTTFMMAISFTTVANVLVMTALSPVFTALSSRIFLHHRLPARTWIAIAVAVCGIAYMYITKLNLGSRREMLGVGLALLVPVSASMQFLLMHREKQRTQRLKEQAAEDGSKIQAGRDMLLAVMIGAVISALFCLPFALPFKASGGDMVWLALLGMFQLAIPCSLLVLASRVLHAPEISLLGQLETIFGILLAWWGAGEVPDKAVFIGAGMVLGALSINELLGWKEHRQ